MATLERNGLSVRDATPDDTPTIAQLNARVFLGNRDSVESATNWVETLRCAYPCYQYFILEREASFLGYVGWQIHGGFLRAEPVVELEQLAILPEHKGQGLALELIDLSAELIRDWIKQHNTRIESSITFFVWCYTLNFDAMRVYAKWFTDAEGLRRIHGDRSETMFRRRLALVRGE